MILEIQTSSEGMSSRIAQQEVIANNLANVNTAGFKKDRVFQEALEQAAVSEERNNEVTVFEQGALRKSESPLDLALVGDGFFVVQTPNGERYTRNGHFQLDPQGLLILDDDVWVEGMSGPIEIKGPVTVNERGEIFQGSELLDRLRIVTFDKPFPLRKEGNHLFYSIDDSASPRESTDTSIKQGFLEQSNVNPIEEMVKMLTIYRYFEADQKVLQTQDDLLDRAVNEIGRV